MTPHQYKALFNLSNQPLYHFGFQIVRKTDVAEDIAAAAFYALWENQQGFNHLLGGTTDEKFLPESFCKAVKVWLYEKVKNDSYNHIKSENRRNKVKADIKYTSDDSAEMVFVKSELVHLQKLIEKLPEKRRIIFVMWINQYKPSEIAAKLKINVNTVRVQYARAIRDIKYFLSPAEIMQPVEEEKKVPEARIRTECKHGHPLTPDNITITKSGGIICKICNRAASLKSYYKFKGKAKLITHSAFGVLAEYKQIC